MMVRSADPNSVVLLLDSDFVYKRTIQFPTEIQKENSFVFPSATLNSHLSVDNFNGECIHCVETVAKENTENLRHTFLVARANDVLLGGRVNEHGSEKSFILENAFNCPTPSPEKRKTVRIKHSYINKINRLENPYQALYTLGERTVSRSFDSLNAACTWLWEKHGTDYRYMLNFDHTGKIYKPALIGRVTSSRISEEKIKLARHMKNYDDNPAC